MERAIDVAFLAILMTGAMTMLTPDLRAQEHPCMYVTADRIRYVKAKVQTGKEPWATAHKRMIADADEALAQKPLSVTDGGQSRSHNYDDGAFGRGGTERHDYMAAIKMCRAIRRLGLGYAFTGKAAYPDKAIELIRAWCLSDLTHMRPRYTTSQSVIEVNITIPGLFYGADLIWDYPKWDPADKKALADWAQRMGDRARKYKTHENNFDNWRLVLISTAACICGDRSLLDYAFDHYRQIIPVQIAASGRMEKEYTRKAGLSYSLYAINAMVQTAEIARNRGVDLYSYKSPDGRGLELALDFMVGFAVDPSTWPWTQEGGFTGKDSTAQFELAYAFFQKPQYLAVINKYGRPMYERRTMGPTTLTHAHGKRE
jgi:hypothetical protein